MNPQAVWTPDEASKLADGTATVWYRRTKSGFYVWISQRADGSCDVSTTRDFEGNGYLEIAWCPSLHSARLWATKRFNF